MFSTKKIINKIKIILKYDTIYLNNNRSLITN